MEPHSDSSPTIGRYELVDTIARGVYRARHPTLNGSVALKRLAARFERAAALEHPNIVSVFDCFEHEGVPYVALEYMDGGSLRPWMGRLSELQAIGALEGMLAGLAHAHEHGLAHRGLKPENVLLGRGGVKIADLGMAAAPAPPIYLAPERATTGDAGPSTDLYALGVIAFELLCGRPPFGDDGNPVSLLCRHVHEPAPPLTRVDPQLAAWVALLLAKDPAARPASAAAAWETLEDYVLDAYGPRWRREAAIGAAPRPEVLRVYASNGAGTDATLEVTDAARRPVPRPLREPSVGPRPVPRLLREPSVDPRPVPRPLREPSVDPRPVSRPLAPPAVGRPRLVTHWRRRGRPLPSPSADHVGRASEIALLRDAIAAARVVNVYGEPGSGKTHVLVEALRAWRRDVVVLDGRGQSADDLRHKLSAVRGRRLARRSALVAIEDAALGDGELRRLLDGAPNCRIIVSTRERVLRDGPAIKIGGLAPACAPALAEQELGRALAADERAAAIALAASLSGHPLRLRQAFSLARESGVPLSAVAAPPLLQDRLRSLSALEARVVRTLAACGGAAVAEEHVRSIVSAPEHLERRLDGARESAGAPLGQLGRRLDGARESVGAAAEHLEQRHDVARQDLGAALERLQRRHDVAREHGRCRLLGVLAHALPLADDLAEETRRAAAHFAGWLQGVDPDAALAEMPAILAVLERSFLIGDHAEAIGLGRAAEGRLSRRRRWAAWARVLDIILASAEALASCAPHSTST